MCVLLFLRYILFFIFGHANDLNLYLYNQLFLRFFHYVFKFLTP